MVLSIRKNAPRAEIKHGIGRILACRNVAVTFDCIYQRCGAALLADAGVALLGSFRTRNRGSSGRRLAPCRARAGRASYHDTRDDPRPLTVPILTHSRATCSGVGSAQQYQGSLRYGTVARGIRWKFSRGTWLISVHILENISRRDLSRFCSTSTRRRI